MNVAQRIRYVTEARKAYRAEGKEGSGKGAEFDDWRHGEVAYAVGGPKRFADLTQLELTCCLIHFRALIHGERLRPEDILERAVTRQREGRLGPLRALFYGIEPAVRIKVMRERFRISLFEEFAAFSDSELCQARWTLQRLARDYPAGDEQREHPTSHAMEEETADQPF